MNNSFRLRYAQRTEPTRKPRQLIDCPGDFHQSSAVYDRRSRSGRLSVLPQDACFPVFAVILAKITSLFLRRASGQLPQLVALPARASESWVPATSV